VLFLASFGVGFAFDRLALPDTAATALQSAHPLAIAATIVGVLLVASAAGLFSRRRTTIVPHEKPRVLVASGPYRLSRNPMYLGLVLIHLGGAILVPSYGALAALILPVWALQKRIIPSEERNMAATFGEEYRSYSRKVRRWI
jgi:protein-S-isoprenylcysteine O-methyltransferase Ste14